MTRIQNELSAFSKLKLNTNHLREWTAPPSEQKNKLITQPSHYCSNCRMLQYKMEIDNGRNCRET